MRHPIVMTAQSRSTTSRRDDLILQVLHSEPGNGGFDNIALCRTAKHRQRRCLVMGRVGMQLDPSVATSIGSRNPRFVAAPSLEVQS